MSEYTFGNYDPSDDTSDLGETDGQQQGPKWFREGLAKLSGQVNELKAENDRLKAAQVKGQVADALKAKGYAPDAASLYSGTPDKLDDWLSAHAGALAKLPATPGEEAEQEQAPQGPPASVVPADDQAQMQRMQNAGAQGALPPQGSEAELVQRLKNASQEEFVQIMQAAGNTHNWG